MVFVIQDDIEQYAFQHTQAEPDYLQVLTQQTYQQMESPQMLTGRLKGCYLLATMLGLPRFVSLIGFSSLTLPL